MKIAVIPARRAAVITALIERAPPAGWNTDSCSTRLPSHVAGLAPTEVEVAVSAAPRVVVEADPAIGLPVGHPRGAVGVDVVRVRRVGPEAVVAGSSRCRSYLERADLG